jgi:ParB family chromosome partitioning protein
VRAEVATAPTIALPLMLGHTISGSSLWRVDVVSQRGATDAISESVETSASETAFDSERRIALDLLGLYPDTTTVTGYGYDRDINALRATAAKQAGCAHIASRSNPTLRPKRWNG